MFGAMSFGTSSRQIGRKKTIMICVAIFSGFTFLGAFASNPIEFGILRFLAGLGIGGVMPNVVALMTEYAPKRIRSTLVCGYVQWLCYWWHDLSFTGCMVSNRLWLENHVRYRHHSIFGFADSLEVFT